MQNLLKANAALLFAGVASFILMGAGQSLYGPALPAFSRSFDISVATAGFLVSAHWIGCALGVAVMYIYTQRVTPRYVLAFMAAGAVLMALGPSFAVTLLGGVLFGAGYGAATVVFNPRVLAAFGPRGPAMLSLLNASFAIGAIAAPLVFVALSGQTRATLLLLAALVVGVWLFARNSSAAPAPHGAPDAGPNTAAHTAPLASAPFAPHWPILIFHACAIGIEASLIGLGPTALIRAGETEVRAAELLSMFFIGFLLARLSLIGIAHRFSAMTLATLAVAGAGVSALFGAMAAPALGFIAMGFFAAMFFPCLYVAASATMRGHPRTAVAIIAAGMVGGILAPVILSPVLPMLGERGFFWLVAGFCAVMVAAAIAQRARLMGLAPPAPAA
jgi:fucose permease